MKIQVITIGSATRDIFLVPKEVKVLDNEQDITQRKLMAFEYGAKVEAEDLSFKVGGTAVNVAIGLERQGIKTGIVCAIGNDASGKEVLDFLEKEQIDTNQVKILKNNETDRSLIILDKKTGERTIFVNKHTGKDLKIDCSLFKSEAVYISSLKYAWEEKYATILKCALKNKLRIFVNPGEKQVKAGINKLKDFLSQVEVIFMNLDEAIEFTGQKVEIDIEKIIARIAKLGPKIIVITNGENGVYISKGKDYFHIPSQKIDPLDVTGSGDAFASGFLASYLKGKSLKEAGENGIRNSVSVLSQVGTLEGLLKKE